MAHVAKILLDEVTAALRRDSLDGVQSVQADVNHPDEISFVRPSRLFMPRAGAACYG